MKQIFTTEYRYSKSKNNEEQSCGHLQEIMRLSLNPGLIQSWLDPFLLPWFNSDWGMDESLHLSFYIDVVSHPWHEIQHLANS